MISQRINKLLANYGVCSRRKVDLMIKDRKILVNGVPAVVGMKVNPVSDKIYMDGKEIKNINNQSQILLLNKPKNVLSTCIDNYDRKTVIDFLPEQYKKGFYPIGRLDFLSRGALLITNNGKICYQLSHPKFSHKKIYIVKMYGDFKEDDLDTWRSGVELDGKKTNPCEIEVINKGLNYFSYKITLKEGRNRQIRRIASKFGYKVVDLQRVNFANIALGNLKEGEWKIINKNKIEGIK